VKLIKKWKHSIKKRLNTVYVQVRRRFIYYTNRDYIYESLKRRRGECIGCGACCRTTWKCPFLYTENGQYRCKIHTKKPELCSLYPFDEKDMFKHAKKCGFYFVKNEEDK